MGLSDYEVVSDVLSMTRLDKNGQDNFIAVKIDDYAKDGGEELFTKMHCVL